MKANLGPDEILQAAIGRLWFTAQDSRVLRDSAGKE
jgi:hypothetical protein